MNHLCVLHVSCLFLFTIGSPSMPLTSRTEQIIICKDLFVSLTCEYQKPFKGSTPTPHKAGRHWWPVTTLLCPCYCLSLKMGPVHE